MLRLVLLCVVLVTSACSPSTDESPTMLRDPMDPAFVNGTDHGESDRLAATVAVEAQRYWAGHLPGVAAKPWSDLSGGFVSVDSTSENGAPPCSESAAEVTGNAYYCATEDAIVWDRAALLPVLRENYGEAAVALVLGHEMGHAVQQRSGVDVGGTDVPPVRLETGADCSAGSFLRWVHDGESDRLQLTDEQLDDALRALIVFRDPVGEQGGALHGGAYDRVAALQDGYQSGPAHCGEPADHSLTSAERGHRDAATVLEHRRPAEFFDDLAARRSIEFDPPAAPTAAELADVHYEIGDQASETLLAVRYASAYRAAVTENSRAPTRAGPGPSELCLAGAYTGWLGARDELSDGDLDEAVELVLDRDQLDAPNEPQPSATAFGRFAAFRSGVSGGPAACTDR